MKKSIDYSLKYKAFTKAIDLYTTDTRAFNNLLKDKRISFGEKKVLQSLIYFKKGQISSLLETTKDLKFEEPFFQAYVHMLIGVSYNNIGQYKKAISNLKTSISLYEKAHDNSFITSPLKNICITLSNQNNKGELDIFFKKYSKIKRKTDLEKFNYLRVMSMHLSVQGNNKKAHYILDEALDMKSPKIKSEKHLALMQKIILYIEDEQLTDALETLEQSKKHSLFAISSNYNYFKTLLNHMVKDDALYAYKSKYKECPDLFHKISIIKEMTSGNIQGAKTHWDQLKIENPSLYGDYFNYKCRKDIFSICMDRYKKISRRTLNKAELDHLSTLNNIEKVEFIFSSKSRIHREKLIELIWGEYKWEYEQRITVLVARARKKYDLNIKYLNEEFQLKAS